jgi:rubrerythrin
VSEHDFLSANAALGAAEVLDVDAMRLLFKVECSGEDFYNQLADRVGNAEAADLLRRNGREELGHARRIQRALGLKLGEPFEPTADMLERFAIPLPDEVGPDLFPIIIQAEVQGDAGYQRWADAEPDPEVARLLRLNGREETIHATRAREALALLQATAPSEASS